MAPIFTVVKSHRSRNKKLVVKTWKTFWLVVCWLVVCWIQLNKKTTNIPTNGAKMHSSPIWLVVGWIQFLKNKKCQPFM